MTTVPAGQGVATRPPLRERIDWRPYTMLLVLILVALAFQLLTDGLFLTPRNLSNLARQASLVAILASGMVAVIVSGNIDLSAGSAVGLVAVVAAWGQVDAGLGPAGAVVLAVIVGLGLGIWQGAWIAYGNIPSFVVTLGGMLIFRGIALVITEGETLSPLDDAYTILGQEFLSVEVTVAALTVAYVVALVLLARRRRARQRHGLRVAPAAAPVALAILLAAILAAIAWWASLYRGIPFPVVAMVVVALVLSVMLRRTTFGRRIYAIGGNRDAARFSGIDIRLHTFAVFVLMGLLYAVVGILLSARLDAGPPNAGQFMELDAIAAAVIGGASLFGGIGTVEGALIGAFLMASIANGMSLLNVLSWWQQIVTGLLLMGAVFIDINSRRRSR
jgi:D-xylose transport system permease protein